MTYIIGLQNKRTSSGIRRSHGRTQTRDAPINKQITKYNQNNCSPGHFIRPIMHLHATQRLKASIYYAPQFNQMKLHIPPQCESVELTVVHYCTRQSHDET